MLRNVDRANQFTRRRDRRWEPSSSVHGTEPQGVEPCGSYAVPRAGNRHTGQLWQGAVATPVSVALRPPETLCTPIVASRVATAHLNIHR
mgnify:CR=1 FL=1